EIELRSGKTIRKMNRGDIAVFKPGESYQPPPGGAFFEVAIKANHPPVQSPRELIPPEKNAIRYDGERFFIFEERLDVGDTRQRHSHSQRVVMQLNRTRLQQWPEGSPEIFVDVVPDRATFNPPVIHTVKNVGDAPLRGIVIEFKPERQKPPQHVGQGVISIPPTVVGGSFKRGLQGERSKYPENPTHRSGWILQEQPNGRLAEKQKPAAAVLCKSDLKLPPTAVGGIQT